VAKPYQRARCAIFSVVYGTLLEPLPYRDSEQLVMIWSKPNPNSRNSAAAGDFLEREHGLPWNEKKGIDPIREQAEMSPLSNDPFFRFFGPSQEPPRERRDAPRRDELVQRAASEQAKRVRERGRA
jgi:hypothetical protein